MSQLQRKIKTKLGDWYLIASGKGLQSILREKQDISSNHKNPKATQFLDQAEEEINQYFSGRLKEFKVPLDIQGTEFQKKVWRQLSKIPYGETCSYQDIATKIKQPKACRAVGTANGKNPLSIIIPCHRVITADGKLGGYSGGLNTKTKLLAIEGVKTKF